MFFLRIEIKLSCAQQNGSSVQTESCNQFVVWSNLIFAIQILQVPYIVDMTLITLSGQENWSEHMLFANAQRPFVIVLFSLFYINQGLTESCYKLPVQYIRDLYNVKWMQSLAPSTLEFSHGAHYES